MKNLILPFLLLGALSAQAVKLEVIPVDHVYSPKGYSSNDDVEIVVEGVLPNLCYKGPRSLIEVDGRDINVAIKAQYNDSGAGCAEMVVPYLESVKLGILDKGWYRVMINGEQKSDLYIDEFISNGLEDEILANIESIEIEEGSNVVKLRGQNVSDCLVHDEIVLHSNNLDAYSIKPLMVQVSDFCPMKMVPFELELEIPNDLEASKILLHVRSLNGNSINKVVNFR